MTEVTKGREGLVTLNLPPLQEVLGVGKTRYSMTLSKGIVDLLDELRWQLRTTRSALMEEIIAFLLYTEHLKDFLEWRRKLHEEGERE